jgi:hypothetical protein
MRRIQWGRILLDVPVPKADWLVGLWRRTADVFMQDAGDQALIGQTFLQLTATDSVGAHNKKDPAIQGPRLYNSFGP